MGPDNGKQYVTGSFLDEVDVQSPKSFLPAGPHVPGLWAHERETPSVPLVPELPCPGLGCGSFDENFIVIAESACPSPT